MWPSMSEISLVVREEHEKGILEDAGSDDASHHGLCTHIPQSTLPFNFPSHIVIKDLTWTKNYYVHKVSE